MNLYLCIMVQKVLFIFSTLLLSVLLVQTSSCRHEPIIPDHTVCFQSEIHPVVISRCSMTGCHNTTGGSEEIPSLVTYTEIRSFVTPGNPKESKLYKAFVHHSGEANITVKPTSYEKAIVKLWIQQGAVNDTTCI